MPKQKLKGIQFGVLTHEQIKEIGVVEVTESTLHTKGIPKAGSAADTRFGTCSRFYRCGTCKHSVLNCPGHPGYILFPYPVPHVAFIMYMTRILNLFCFNCSCYLLEDMEFPESVQTPKKRLIYAYEEARKARARKRTPLMCPNPECGLPQPTVYVDEPFVKLAWRDDLLESYFGPEITAGAHSASKKGRAPSRKRGRKSKQEEEPRQKELTPEEQMLLEQRRADYEHFVKRPFTNWDAYNVLKSIKRTDLMYLGINAEETHPSGFMLLSLLVPAIGVRPTVSFEEGSRRRGYHQLTRKISDIVKQKRALMVEANNCKIRLGDETLAIDFPESLKHALQMFYVTVSHYLVKDKCKVPGLKLSPYAARAHARAQSASQALSGKNGRYRSTLMGKRVDFCLRTVVTPNPDADIDEIGIPEELARRLTVPIRVSHNNREALHKLMAEGGVMQVVDERTGNMIAVGDHNCKSLVLMDGWIVERYLKDGDWIPINRQPTLHRPSIMGHRVKIHKDRVLKLNDAVTTPYNADHDGDEMNGHVPQTPEARAEVQELMAVTNHIMHPRGNRPVIGLIQDRLDAGYFLTHPDTFFTREQAMDLLMTIHYDRDAPDAFALGSEGAKWKNPQLPPPARTQPEPLWGGKQIVSCLLPRINMERDIRNRPKGDDERSRLINRLIIRDGEMLSGTLCKQTLGTTSGGIIHLTCLYCGNNTAARFISDMQRLLNRFMVSVGFSIGIKDCMTEPAVQAKIDTVVDAAERFVGKIKDMAAEMPNDPEVQNLAEQKISGTLKSLLHMVGNVVRANLDDTNMFNVMANICGSKGSVFNMAQVMALVGPTFVNGERPNATGTNRVLPSAPLPGQKALSVGEELRMHGFIRRPYKAGLTMPDAFLHNMGGREGLVDTAAKTSRTGYLQRRAVKAMESHHIAHDGTVRDAYQKMYQCHFGNDGLNPMQTVKVTLKSLMLDNDALRRRCIADELLDPANAQHKACMVQEWTALLELRDEMRQAKITHSQTNLAQNLDVYIPFHVEILAEQERVSHGQARLTADELIRAQGYVDQVCTLLQSEVPSLFTVYHIRDEMSTGRLLGHHRIGLDSVRRLCYRVVEMHRKARLQPGEGIGALTATSTGEPLSQMTLNTFHQAGTANAGMTFGVPRMKELIGASKNISTPVMTLPIKRDMANPKVAAEVLARSLPFTLLRNIIRSTNTVYEPDLMTSHVKEDVELVRQHAPFMEHILDRACPWVIRFELCKTRSGARSLEPRGIADLIQEELGDFALVISNRVQDETWAIRVYLVDVQATVDQALKKSIRTGTTRTATKRASQRVSITTRKRRRFADLSHLAGKNADESVLPVPLHRIDPVIERTTHTSRDVIEWMVARNTQMDLKNGLKVCGIPNISAATVRVNDCTRIDASTGAVRIEEEYVVDVRGSNLAQVSMLGMIDMGRIVSNHVMVVYETLGITAAAHTLFQELYACLSASGSRVDERLIKLLVDVMTHNGFVMPISRHGLNRLREHGVLAKITFEETLEMLFEASALGYFDPLLGVSENTMVGRQARLGTNLTKMMVEHNGQRVLCKDHARCGEGPDTRVLMSVVTEECQEDFEEEEMEYVEPTKELDHILTVRNGNAEPAQAYETGGASAVNPALYEQHFYHQPNAMAPIEPDTNPFRPSSPTLTSHDMHRSYTEEMTEAFCPSSPVFD